MAAKTQNSRSTLINDEVAAQLVAEAIQVSSPDAWPSLEAPATEAENALAANKVLELIPDVGSGTGEGEHERWRKGTAAVIHAARFSKSEYDLACLVCLLMAVLDHVHTPDKTYKKELDEQGITPPNSNHPFAPASAAIFGRNIKDSRQASKDIHKDCRAFDGLQILVNDRPDGLRSFSRSREGVRALLAIAMAKGGISGLGAIEASPKGGEAPRPLHLNRERVREIVAERARARLSAKGVSLAVVARHVAADGAINYEELKEEDRLPFEPEELVLSHMPAADDRVQLLAELFHLSHSIRERKTDRPIDANHDPKDPSTPMRVTSRQFVIRRDGTITVSPILTPSAPVIYAHPFAEGGLLRQPMHGDVVLQTYGRRRAEINILPTATRGVWDFKVVDPGRAEAGVGRIQITTEAQPLQADGGVATDVGSVLQQVTSSTSEYPLVATDNQIQWQAQCEINQLAFAAHATVANELARVLGRRDQPLTLGIRDQVLSVLVARTEHKLSINNCNGEDKIVISAQDYADFLSAMAELRNDIVSPIACTIGREDVIRWKFRTRLASYEVFIPAFREGRRSNRSIGVLQPQAWPADVPMKFDI
ncbi:hypothetical protein [Methylobacterium sp. SI9]|uniref:hypothetical protein n=1 Tax=Methylobacterium guangdongense TaxID=3138811 RepID=UPI00313F3175